MTEHTTLTFFILTSFLCLNPGCRPEGNLSDQRPPNIILIVADDLGYGDLSCYGQQILKTPNIDLLAKEGMRFTRFYAGATVCAPSRSALLTGRHTGHCSVRGNAPPGQLTRPEEITIPEALKEAGYRSAIIGKWGVGHPPPPDDPLQHGFDHAYGYINMWHAHNFYPEFLYRNGRKVKLEGNVTDRQYEYRENMPEGTGVAKERNLYAPFEIEKEAIQFIRENREQPIFLYLALNMPHANNEAGYFTGDGMEVPSYGAFDTMSWPQPEKGFARMIAIIDETVGRIRSELKTLGMESNTLILFTSDNGPHQEGGHEVDFFDSNGALRGWKRDLYEGGIRVPLIACWPGKIPSGTSSDHIFAFWDLLPTCCEFAGAGVPENIDGISMASELLAEKGQDTHDYLYWEFYEQGGRQAILQGNWKYVKLNVRDPEREVIRELYNLGEDPSETENIFDHHRDVAASMEKLMEEAHVPSPHLSLFQTGQQAETRY